LLSSLMPIRLKTLNTEVRSLYDAQLNLNLGQTPELPLFTR